MSALSLFNRRPRSPRLLEGATLRFNTQIASLADLDADLVVVCAGMGLARSEILTRRR